MTSTIKNETSFGFETIDSATKAKRVATVFESVAPRYDLMNDLMSGGLHRLWKAFTITQSGVKEGSRVLDIAGGTGDLTRAFVKKAGKSGEVWLSDINPAMLSHGRDKLCDSGVLVPVVQCDAEQIPFPNNYFDCVCVAFGLRNMTCKEKALAEMYRVLRPGGRVLVLEFSKIWAPLSTLYERYSFKCIPFIGEMVTGDRVSYRYLAESIRMHPDQETLKGMLETEGFERVDYYNLTLGVVALHRGFKF